MEEYIEEHARTKHRILRLLRQRDPPPAVKRRLYRLMTTFCDRFLKTRQRHVPAGPLPTLYHFNFANIFDYLESDDRRLTDCHLRDLRLMRVPLETLEVYIQYVHTFLPNAPNDVQQSLQAVGLFRQAMGDILDNAHHYWMSLTPSVPEPYHGLLDEKYEGLKHSLRQCLALWTRRRDQIQDDLTLTPVLGEDGDIPGTRVFHFCMEQVNHFQGNDIFHDIFEDIFQHRHNPI